MPGQYVSSQDHAFPIVNAAAMNNKQNLLEQMLIDLLPRALVGCKMSSDYANP